MCTRSSSNLPVVSPSNPSTSNPKRRNRRRLKQPFILEEFPIDTMADQRTMAELLRAPTEGYAEAIMVPSILAEQFELKHSPINMMTSDQFFVLEKDNPHDHIRWFNKITSTIKYKDVPNSAIKLMLFLFSLAAMNSSPSRTTNLRNEISNFQQRFDESFHEAWDRYKDLICACPHRRFTEFYQLDTFYNALNPADQDSLNSAASGNLKSVVSQVKSYDANSNSSSKITKLTHAVNQQTSVVTTAMTTILKQFQATPPPAFVKAVEEICVTCGGAHPYYQCLAAGGNTFPELRDNIQGYVSAAAINYNKGNAIYRPSGMANQIRPSSFAQPNVQNNQNRFSQPQGYNQGNNFNQEQSYQAPTQQNQVVQLNELEKVKRMNVANIKAMQTQINIVKNELRNEMKNSIQASLSNQTNEIKNMMASLFQMNIASTSGPGSLPSNTVANPKGKIKAITTQSGIILDGPTVPTPPPFINLEVDEHVEETLTDQDLSQYTIKVLPPPVQKYKPSSRDYVVHQRDPLYPKIPYPSRMLKQKQQEKDEIQIHKFWQMFKQLHINITLADALIFMPNINLMPLSVWKKLGLPKLISTRMTLQLANRAICTSAGIARDVFVPVGKFTLPADFVIVDYEIDPRVPLILGRPFLRTARALIDIHGEEMILREGDDRLTLNMRHDTSRYSNQPQKESFNLINVFNNSSEDFLEDLFSTNQPSGNPTFSSHPELTSPDVKDDIFNPEGGNVLYEKLLDLDSTKYLHPPLHVKLLSGSTTYSSSPSQLLEELALITFLAKYDDDFQFDVESDLKEIEFLLHQDIDSSLKDSIDQSNRANLADNLVDSMPEMFTDEHALDYSSPLILDEYDDDLFKVEPNIENVYDDPFDSKGEKIKESKLLIAELDHPFEPNTENVYDDPFDSKGEKIKESKLLIAELDHPCDFLPSFEYHSCPSEDFSRVDALPSINNEDKVFNPCIFIQENPFESITRVVQDKKLAISNASLVLKDFDPPLYELSFLKEVPRSKMLLPFSSKNEEKVFKPGIYTSEKVYSSLITELSYQGYKIFKINQVFKSPMKNFLFSCRKDTHILAIPYFYFYPP
nr:hypothetical protein [Tanacetum cinerariifolium]